MPKSMDPGAGEAQVLRAMSMYKKVVDFFWEKSIHLEASVPPM